MSSKKSKQVDEMHEYKRPQTEIDLGSNSKFDLDAYISGYTGYTRVKRLTFIAARCPALRLKGFRLAIDELKKGMHTQLYLDCVSQAREMLGGELGEKWGLDNEWLTTTMRKSQETSNLLEHALTRAKKLGERQPTREACMALAQHFMDVGDFQAALTQFLEMKEYGSSNRHSLETCLGVIRTSIFSGSMNHVKNQAQRAQSLPEIKSNPVWGAQVSSAHGLYNLKGSNFSAAASNFLGTSFVVEGAYTDVLTARDVAVYGSVCALASFSRRDLKNRVLGSESFKKFLELVPEWQQIILDFHDSNYTSCFKALDALKPTLLLDIYLAPHVPLLITRIMDRALVQYFRPFVSVKMHQMAAAFSMDLATLEKKLVALIADDKIQARIDSHNKVLYARHADQRNATFQQALSIGNKYNRDIKTLLMRMSFTTEDFVVRHPDQERRRRQDEKKE